MSTQDYLAIAEQAQQGQIKAWGESLQKTPERRSQSIGKLIEALAKAQLEFDPVKKENSNPFFKSKYADLATVLGATQKHLAKYGLVVVQEPIVNGNRAGVRTVVAHSSGEWWDMGELLLPLGKQDAQGAGSALTYSRRYAYQSAVGVSAEEDDDGNAAVSNGKALRDYEAAADQREAAAQLSIGQVNAIRNACKEGGKTEGQLAEYIKTKHGAANLEQLSGPQFQATLKWARSNGDLADTLKTSVKAEKAKKEKFNEGLASLSQTTAQTMITDEDVPF